METHQLNNIDELRLDEQLFLINEFHKNVMGYKGFVGMRLDNKIGGLVEQYKVNIKRLKRYLKNIRLNTACSDFERILLKKGFEYIQRAENCITEIYNSGYMNIIERTMKRREICLGNPDVSNPRKGDKLEIKNIDKCAYNSVEMDCFYLLSKFKKRGIDLDYISLVNKFCEYENLDKNSSRYILALLSYPYDFMKCCNRYREKTKSWSEEEYEESLQRAMIKDGKSLI